MIVASNETSFTLIALLIWVSIWTWWIINIITYCIWYKLTLSFDLTELGESDSKENQSITMPNQWKLI